MKIDLDAPPIPPEMEATLGEQTRCFSVVVAEVLFFGIVILAMLLAAR